MICDRPVIGGGIDSHGRPWAGGSLDSRAHDYPAQQHSKPQTVCCLKNVGMESKNHKSITNGVENCPKLTPKNNRLLISKLIWSGVVDTGFDLYFLCARRADQITA